MAEILELVGSQGEDILASTIKRFILGSEIKQTIISDLFKEVIKDNLENNAIKSEYHMSKLYAKIIAKLDSIMDRVKETHQIKFGDMFDNFIDVAKRDPDSVKELGQDVIDKLQNVTDINTSLTTI